MHIPKTIMTSSTTTYSAAGNGNVHDALPSDKKIKEETCNDHTMNQK
jgi:hypothetical protein